MGVGVAVGTEAEGKGGFGGCFRAARPAAKPSEHAGPHPPLSISRHLAAAPGDRHTRSLLPAVTFEAAGHRVSHLSHLCAGAACL